MQHTKLVQQHELQFAAAQQHNDDITCQRKYPANSIQVRTQRSQWIRLSSLQVMWQNRLAVLQLLE
jgi:hypothetical protein